MNFGFLKKLLLTWKTVSQLCVRGCATLRTTYEMDTKHSTQKSLLRVLYFLRIFNTYRQTPEKPELYQSFIQKPMFQW